MLPKSRIHLLGRNGLIRKGLIGRRFDHLGDVEAFVTVAEKGSMTEGRSGFRRRHHSSAGRLPVSRLVSARS